MILKGKQTMKCKRCSSNGWIAKYDVFGDPPEQLMCEICNGTGTLSFKSIYQYKQSLLLTVVYIAKYHINNISDKIYNWSYDHE